MIVSTMKFTYTSGDRPLDGFTIKRGIGAGGFGEVYYAVTDAGKEVALKLVQHSHDVELRGVNQCLNLKNPHLVSLYDVKQSDDGETWVVMEYMAGESLEQALDRNPTGLEPDEALRWMYGIAEAVDYLHERGIVHRDLKPANMFLEDGLIKVGDYGLAKFVSVSRRSGHTESVGTVHYMAPEVANGRYGKELDVYAAGIIFYEMLTGRVPFEGESVAEILMKHLTAEPDLSALDEPFRRVLARALAKDPAQRYESLGRMLGDLEAAGVRLPGAGTTRRSSADHRTGTSNRSADQATRAWSPGAGTASKSRFDNVWSAFFREDPLMRLIRRTWRAVWPKLESRPLLLILATIVVVFLTVEGPLPFLAVCVLIYIAVALPFRWFTRLWWSPRPPAPSEAAPPKPPIVEGVPEVGTADPPPGSASPNPQVVPVRHAARGRSKPPMGPVTKSVRRKLSELSGSLFVATLLAFLIAVAMAVVLDFDRPEEVVLLGAVGAVGSWAVLIPAKWWEGTQGDTVVRRLVMLGLGAGVGVVAAAGSNFLLVSLPNEPSVQVELDLPVNWHRQVSRFYDPGGEPLRGAYAIFYASLFLVPRWWKQADPYRKKRFRFGPLFVVGIWALLISAFWEFSDPWGVACAVLIASVVQLASSWHPEELAPVAVKEVAA